MARKTKAAVSSELSQTFEKSRRPSLYPVPDSHKHVSIQAGAGCGKTTTMEWGYRANIKRESCPFIPSDAQVAIMDQFSGVSPAAKVGFFCFNKSIATEFLDRGLPGCTNHSHGFAAVRNYYPRIRVNGDYRVLNLIEKEGINFKKDWELGKLLQKVTSLAKVNLLGWSPGMSPEQVGSSSTWESDFCNLINHYGIDLNGKDSQVMTLVPRLLQGCATTLHELDYDDMIWLPIVRDMKVDGYDEVIVDERQDLNLAQLELLKKTALTNEGRMSGVGDENQAIYGFSGASAEAFSLMTAWMDTTRRGCIPLRLMETRRCPKAVVALAQTLISDFRALPEAPEGRVVRGVTWDQLLGLTAHTSLGSEMAARPGDMLLCRVNAPLVQMAYRFIRAGIKANIQGRDLGNGILSLVKKSKQDTIPTLLRWAEDHQAQEEAKVLASKFPSDAKLGAIEDKYLCLRHLCEGCDSISDLTTRIETIFQDRFDRSKTVLLSSVHRAKGLEAERVFILCPEKMPLPMKNPQPWELVQERNLQYVAWTRSKDTLVFTTTPARSERE